MRGSVHTRQRSAVKAIHTEDLPKELARELESTVVKLKEILDNYPLDPQTYHFVNFEIHVANLSGYDFSKKEE